MGFGFPLNDEKKDDLSQVKERSYNMIPYCKDSSYVATISPYNIYI